MCELSRPHSRSRRPFLKRRISARLLLCTAALLGVYALISGPARADETATAADQPAVAASQTAAPATSPTTELKSPGEYYNAWVLVPPIVTIILAIALRQVIPALGIGILVAAYMVAWSQTPQDFGHVAVTGFTLAVEEFVIGALSDVSHLKIIIFTLLIGGMVGVIAANGGTAAIVNSVARWASTRRRGQVSTWFAGLIVFFDDYANAMIVGPAMRPICDRLKISRAKLAYLVDSTAAPVSSIALISTWIGMEVGLIKKGLDAIGTVPHFLAHTTLDDGFAYDTFLQSIPYRFYPLLALVMVLIIAVLNRDFGPMHRAESTLERPDRKGGYDEFETVSGGKAWYAGVPVLVLVLLTLALLVASGYQAVQAKGTTATGIKFVREVITSSESYNSLLYGALGALVVAALISLGTRRLTFDQIVLAARSSMGRMISTMMVLVCAWALSSAMTTMELGDVTKRMLLHADFNVRWLPLLIFVSACVVSFATGTSWGTMGILCPAAVTMSAGLLVDVAPAEAWPLFYASIGAVLAGAVFGDHCSPISDTTVLSSLASECSLESHVWTQIPYAVVTAAVSTLCGEFLCRELDLSPWLGLAIGVVLLTIIVRFVGRRPKALA